jgi:hypothetical protein
MSRIPVQHSPGVNVSEIDLTGVVPNLATTTGAFAGVFQWGPAGKIVFVSSEDSLASQFGKPVRGEDGIDFHCAAAFLQYGRDLRVVRVLSYNETTANSDGITGLQYINEDVFDENQSGLTAAFYARYPGTLGNSLKVVLLDSNGETTLTTGTTAAAGSNQIKFSTVVGGTLQEDDRIILNTANFTQTLRVDSASGLTATFKSYLAQPIGSGISVKYKSKYADLFATSPSTSTQAEIRGGANDELNVVVIDKDGLFTSEPGSVLETFQNVSKAYDAKNNDGAPNYITSVINNNSAYIWAGDVEELWGETEVKDITYEFTDISTGFAGVSEYSLSGATAERTAVNNLFVDGYSKFADKETADVSLIIAGRADAINVRLLTDMVNDRKDCVLFVSPLLTDVLNKTQTAAASNVVTTRNSTYAINSSYVVMDSGWKYIYDKYNDTFRYIPLNADIAGLCARTEANAAAWFSPAGLNRGTIKNVIKLAFNPDQAARDLLYVAGVNPVATFPGEGTVLFGDKTLLSKPSAFDRINVRRLFVTVEKSIAAAAKYSLFELNDEFTRSQFRNLVIPYLRNVQAQRGIVDFRVVCDETNNTGEVIDRNQFVADIYIKPNRSINFIQLNFIATRTDSTFTEII